jgi:hypothetical protein
MNHELTISTCAKTVLGTLSLLAVICASSQTPRPAQSRTVPLVSDTCPSVRVGDNVSLDLNPLFDPIWPVTGLRDFGLTFTGVAEDGVNLKRQELLLGARHTPTNISPLGNGFFHIELTLSMRSIAPGTYRLVRANANAEVVPEYAVQPPQMTNSPVGERYCITVISSPASQLSQPGG